MFEPTQITHQTPIPEKREFLGVGFNLSRRDLGEMGKKAAGDVAPFLTKLYEMVDDETTDGLISWGSRNDSFVIWDDVEFSTQLLPKYYKHNTLSSFIRQLNIYVISLSLSLSLSLSRLIGCQYFYFVL